MKNVLIIAHYTSLPGELDNYRFEYLAEKLADKYNVTLVTSNFVHKTKTFRKKSNENGKYKISIIDELGYKKNVGIDRIISHLYFEKNIKLFLNNLTEPIDLIYCAYPTMGTAYIAGKYCLKRQIPFVLDIIDVWPESIKSAFTISDKFVDLIIFPLSLYANKIYRMADNLIAVSETYLNRALKANPNAKEKLAIYIGTDLEYFDCIANVEFKKSQEEFWITYIGTLSYSYDIKTLIMAMCLLFDKYPKIKLKILGCGPLEDSFKKEAKKENANVEFFGYLPHTELYPIIKNSNVGLNAIVESAQQSITIKMGDYLSAGLAILNSSLNSEITSIVDCEKIGFNYLPGDYKQLAAYVEYLYQNQEMCILMGKNSRKLAVQKFDRKKSYVEIYKLIDRVLLNPD
jgi:glycosyltransferase involved in cell wall biosynthesis